MISRRRFWAVARKEFLHVLRDWRSLVLALAIPALLILLFGYALNLDLNNVPTVVWDQSRTPESRDFLSYLSGSPYFKVQETYDSYRELQRDLEAGRAMVGIVIPSDFADAIRSERKVSIQCIVDGSDATRARLAQSYASGSAALYNQNLLVQRMGLRGKDVLATPIKLEGRAWYNPDLRSQNDTVPGIIVIVMIVIAAMLTSVTVAREWEMGTMEQLISTPIRPAELVFGKIVPYFAIGLADVAIAVVIGQVLFQVPLRGSTGLLFALASVFLTGALFFGLMLSIVLKKQMLSNQTALLASYLPTLMLSGFVFSIENMPVFFHYFTYLVPARYMIEILRGIYLKGVGLEILWLNGALLCLYAGIMALIANKRMKLRLE